ncbi:DNA (cytosine-5-)-methyltransferase [Adhaeribacter arboris]|uniref:DNA (cytosine-5-)-methyltransferase n=1 Tax=Adhaeribacter arboris TaxID=2072846 RepID=A0A2T2YJU6_9BACT|nr:DNA cytosine methyltransferase [Adhaeribacter arboris]PSR55793.1 DNA (cytosine-5-)-methyltransferase [Adhaeribacter arboris]
MSEELKLPVISFFTGGGFMDMGFLDAGFNIVWTNELDIIFADLYASGITSWKKSKGIDGNFKISNTNSIKDIHPETIIKEAFNGKKPSCFGVIGGPPCQDFSLNGNLDGFKGDKGSLTDAFLYKIIELQPAFFVMENVTGLLKVKKSAKHFLELLEVMKEQFLIDFAILNSIDFGVPQFRERVFVIGINKYKFDINRINIGIDGRWFPFPVNKIYSNSSTKYKWPDPISFGSNVEAPKNIPLELCVQSCLISPEQENNIANSSEFFNILIHLDRLDKIKEGETNRPSFKRLHRYKYSPTTCYGNNEVHLHPFLNRRLSVRESLRIQGVEDSYILPAKLSLTKKFKMIGNGVPVPLAKAVGKSLSDFLESIS